MIHFTIICKNENDILMTTVIEIEKIYINRTIEKNRKRAKRKRKKIDLARNISLRVRKKKKKRQRRDWEEEEGYAFTLRYSSLTALIIYDARG